MPDSLLIAVAGGVAGGVLTSLARVIKTPAEVAHDDRQIGDIDTDLDRFVADEHTRLSLEAVELSQQQKEPEVALDVALAVDRAIHKYRDEETRRIREVRDINASEGFAHWAWRRLRGQPVPTLATPERAQVLIDRWPGMVPIVEPVSGRVRLSDPRGRSIAVILANAKLGDGDEGDIYGVV